MEFKNKQLQVDTLKSCEVHSTNTAKVSVQLKLFNGIPHVGLLREYTPKQGEFQFSAPKPQLKGIFLPLQAWTKLCNEAIPQIKQEIEEQQRKCEQSKTDQASTKSTTGSPKQQDSRKRKAPTGMFPPWL